jgi:hypothetical protein
MQIPESDGKAPSHKAAKLAAPCFGIVRPKGNGKISPEKSRWTFTE